MHTHAGHTVVSGMATSAFFYSRFRVAAPPSLATFTNRLCHDVMLGGMLTEFRLQRGLGVGG